MKVPWLAGLLAFTVALPLALTGAGKKPPIQEKSAGPEKPFLHEKSTLQDDLKLSGELPGVPAGAVRFVSYAELAALPQVTFTVTDDLNFPGKAEITGVYLDEILATLNISKENTLIAAICDDEYEAHYPVEYRAAHHPILVLRVNGKQLALSKRTSHDGSYGPYLISHPSFTSRYQTLAHPEEAQIPNGVIELRFVKEAEALSAIHPRGEFAAGSPQMQGYLIAQENCFRCHNAGGYGGRKAGVSWSSLSKIAYAKPAYFSAYIKDPQSQSGYADMPSFPDYDGKTLAALTAYFQSVAPENGSK
jgi:mono/diheme cytochrome c family protein